MEMDTITKTLKSKLPYEYRLVTSDHQEPRIRIYNTRGQSLLVTRDEITRQLMRDDLDVHRRRMYEAARDELRKERHP